MPPSTFDVNWLQVQPQRFPGCQFAWFRPLQSILPGGTFGSTAAPYMYEIDSSFPQLACLQQMSQRCICMLDILVCLICNTRAHWKSETIYFYPNNPANWYIPGHERKIIQCSWMRWTGGGGDAWFLRILTEGWWDRNKFGLRQVFYSSLIALILHS